MSDNFVHLHAHTSIGSMQDATVSVDELFKRASELGHPALAITDHGTMAAVFDARRSSKKHGVKYIPGCEIYFVDSVEDKKAKRRHLVLLAKNETGYRNLLKINYEGYENFQYIPILGKVFPRVDWDMLEKYNEGIICLTACGSGPIARALINHTEDGWNKEDGYLNALGIANRLHGIFGEDFYLEVQPHDLRAYIRDRKDKEKKIKLDKNGDQMVSVDQPYINSCLVKISKELGIPLVATCDVHYLDKDGAKVHDMLMAINEKKPVSDKTRHRYEVEEFYVKTSGDIISHFSDKFGRKMAVSLCENTIEIANKCEDPVYLDDDDVKFPVFDATGEPDYEDFLEWKSKQNSIPEQEDFAFLRYRSIKAFRKRFGHLPKNEQKMYKDRIIKEIKVLEQRSFSSYILIVADLIKAARDHGIRVGPGRGSVGGCLVAGLLDIHEVDPFEYGLLFERFINVYKASFPDIDTDFHPDGRDWVEQYATDKYGKECVARVSNLSKITPKVVIKDIARSMELGGSKSEAFRIANELTNTISDNTKTFDKALKESKSLRDFIDEYPELEKYCRSLIGLEKNYSTHAAGAIISNVDLSTVAPLRFDKEGTVCVQYEKERCEQSGLIKMDLLGLEHLKVIDSTIENVKSLGEDCIDTTDMYPFDDKGVWDMISKGKTMCVFQMGSPHMRNLCKRIKPRNIEDLSLVNALGRPSAAKSREDYIKCRDHNSEVKHKHKCVEDALKETLGVCVYEDQLMKFANLVAGWDLNAADGLRKLTKYKGKDPAMAEKLERDFIEGAMSHNNMSREDATEIWKTIIEPFGGYGFNKPHGIFYSLNGYHTAYYKHHYPAEFMAAVLKSEVEKTSSSKDKIKMYKKEANRMGIKIVAPNINRSGFSFSVNDKKTITIGLTAINGVGAKAVENIMEVRSNHPFKSFADFVYRTNSRVVNKKVVESLAKAGCFDDLGITRKAAFTYYADVRVKATKHAEKMIETGKDRWDLLDDFEFHKDDIHDEWNKKEILTYEAQTLDEYISGDINDMYDDFFLGNGTPLNLIKRMADGTPVRIEGVIEKVKQDKTKSGKNKGSVYGNCTIMDRNNESMSVKIWSNVWKSVQDKIKEGRPIRALCRVNIWKGNHTLVMSALEKVG